MQARPKQPFSVRLSPRGKRLLVRIAKKLGVSQTAVLELAIRDKAESSGVIARAPQAEAV